MPIRLEFVHIFSKISEFNDDVDKNSKDMSEEDLKTIRDSYFSKYEIQLVDKLSLLSSMIPKNLYIQGIFIKCLNDDKKPIIHTQNVLNILKRFFNFRINDFVLLLMNEITFAKIQCESANFGDLDFKILRNLNDGLSRVSLETNLEINRLFFLYDKNFNEAIDRFYYSLKNIIENSFFFLYDNQGNLIHLKPTEVIPFGNDCQQYNLNMNIPMNILDREEIQNKNSEKSEKILIRMTSKIVLDFYLNEEILYKELIQMIKNRMMDYIGDNLEEVLNDKFMDLSNSTIFSYDVDSKIYITYNNYLRFMMNQAISPYSVTSH
jgi:hypothetical protein